MKSKLRLLDLVHNVVQTDRLTTGQGAFQVATLAPWQMWLASKYEDFAESLAAAEATTIDGAWLELILRVAGQKYAVVTGRSIFQRYFVDESFATNVAVIGSSAGALDQLSVVRPGWRVWGGDFGIEVDHLRLTEIVADIREKEVVLVFIALGSPKQEKWGRLIADQAEVCVIGVGGSVETALGFRKNPPRWVQELKLEWLQRLLQDPRRFVPRISQALSVIPTLVFEALLLRSSAIGFSRKSNRVAGISARDVENRGGVK